MTYFGSRLRYLRKQDGVTQQQLADSLGVAKSTISMYENGQREPDFDTLEAIADFFNVNICTFFPRSDLPDLNLPRQDSLRLKRITSIYLTLNEDGKNYLMAQADFASGREEYLASPPQAKRAWGK